MSALIYGDFHNTWSFLQVLPPAVSPLWEPVQLNQQQKEQRISGPADCKGMFEKLAYNRMKMPDFWRGYNLCPSPSLPWVQLLHTPVTLLFLRNVLVPFHIQLVHPQNSSNPIPLPIYFFLGCWPGKSWHTVDGPELSACWLMTNKHMLIG